MAVISDSLGKALHQFQSKAQSLQLVKDARNPHHQNRYISLGALTDAVLPLINECGLVYAQLPSTTEDGGPALTTMLIHMGSGETLESTTPLILGERTIKGPSGERISVPPGPQEHGSAITYMRRYALMAILGLVADEDDDGNRAARVAPADRRQPGAAPAGPAGATDPQRRKIAAMRDKLLAAELISGESAAKLNAATEDAELSKEKASELINALTEIEKRTGAGGA